MRCQGARKLPHWHIFLHGTDQLKETTALCLRFGSTCTGAGPEERTGVFALCIIRRPSGGKFLMTQEFAGTQYLVVDVNTYPMPSSVPNGLALAAVDTASLAVHMLCCTSSATCGAAACHVNRVQQHCCHAHGALATKRHGLQHGSAVLHGFC